MVTPEGNRFGGRSSREPVNLRNAGYKPALRMEAT